MKLRRVLKGKIIGGVCTGLAERTKVDVAFIRILFLIVGILTFAWLMGIIYLVLWVSMSKPIDSYEEKSNWKNELVVYFAALLIGIGSLMLLNIFIPINIYKYSLPLGFIMVGIFMIVMAMKKNNNG